jgi:hypothetical protein
VFKSPLDKALDQVGAIPSAIRAGYKAETPTQVEDPKKMKLLKNAFQATDFVTRHLEWKELAEAGRLDLQHSLGIVGVVERHDVETQAVADLL